MGYLGNGHLSVTSNWTVPQWQEPVWVVRSSGEVSSTMVMILGSIGRGERRRVVILDALVEFEMRFEAASVGIGMG